MKTCVKCGIEQASELYPPGRRKCLACKRAYQKAYRAANRKRLMENHKAWTEANSEKVAAQRKGFREANRERLCASQLAYRAKNLDRENARNSTYRAANLERILAQQKAYREKNQEARTTRERERYRADPVAANAQQKARRLADPEKYNARQRERKRADYAASPEKYGARHARRRAMKTQQTPAWSEETAIVEFYKNRPDGMHVDHIIPLKGQRYGVSGLHVLANLQYLPGPENLRKGNRFSPGDYNETMRQMDV